MGPQPGDRGGIAAQAAGRNPPINWLPTPCKSLSQVGQRFVTSIPWPMSRSKRNKKFSMDRPLSTRFWTAPVLWRFGHRKPCKSGRGLPTHDAGATQPTPCDSWSRCAVKKPWAGACLSQAQQRAICQLVSELVEASSLPSWLAAAGTAAIRSQFRYAPKLGGRSCRSIQVETSRALFRQEFCTRDLERVRVPAR